MNKVLGWVPSVPFLSSLLSPVDRVLIISTNMQPNVEKYEDSKLKQLMHSQHKWIRDAAQPFLFVKMQPLYQSVHNVIKYMHTNQTLGANTPSTSRCFS